MFGVGGTKVARVYLLQVNYYEDSYMCHFLGVEPTENSYLGELSHSEKLSVKAGCFSPY